MSSRLMNAGRMLKQVELRYGKLTALVNVERNRAFSYWELHEITNKVCNMLRDTFGLREGDRYATLVENDNMALVLIWMLKSLCTVVWLGIRDSLEEHLYQIDYTKPRLIFIEKQLLPEYYEFLSERNMIIISMDKPDVPMRGLYYFWELIDQSSPSDPDAEYGYDDVNKHICLLKFTGGTTGKGKCAMFSLENFLSAATNSSWGTEVFLSENPKLLVSTPLTHAASSYVLPCYFRGGTIVTINRVDIEQMCQTVEKERIDLLQSIPTVLYRMVDMGLTKKYDLSSLKIIRYGASPISPSKLEVLIKEFGRIFVQGYAATESWTPCTILGRNDHDVTTEAGRKRLHSLGRVVPGMEVKISDDNGCELAIGEVGEIWIRGPITIQGYHNDPEQTKENFSGDGFFKSGDMGYMDNEGFIYLVDRKKDMIISGGFNVYAVEVENCLNSHAAVKESAVVGIPDDYWGEAVHAEVVLKEAERIGQEELINYCKQHIARYKAPKTIKFVTELPLSPIGKVLRRAIKEKYWENQKRRIH